MNIEIGKIIKQKNGLYSAFIPNPFPPKLFFSDNIIKKASHATLLLGKLDGITQLLPDIDFFLFMYIRKDASSSSQIEGTMATMIDVIEAESKTKYNLPSDVDDIIHYIYALNYGINRLKEFPLSLRFIKEIHKELMDNARSSHFSDPGNFRTSQNWIGGNSINNATFVPPPPFEMNKALDDLEKFIHNNSDILPIIKAAIIHSQFETIHPFLDGNGRTGRMLTSLILSKEGLIEKPVLFLSSYFNKNREIYYKKLDSYHNNQIESWLDFFLDGVIHISEEAIETVKHINKLREEDTYKIQCLGKKTSSTFMKILVKLYELPIINVAKIQEWTGYTRQGAQKVINSFIELGILEQKDTDINYGRSYIYKRYVDIFY